MSSSSLYTLNCSLSVRQSAKKSGTQSVRRRTRVSQAMANENGNLPVMKKISSAGKALSSCENDNSLFSQSNTIAIVGGMSDYSTLLFLENFSRNLKDEDYSIPFVIYNDPALREEHFTRSDAQNGFKNSPVLENLSQKLSFLENLGARCIVMPCNFLHQWHNEVSQRSNLPILDVGDSVAEELKEAKLKPLEAGSRVRIGILAINPTLMHSFYKEKLQNQTVEEQVVYEEMKSVCEELDSLKKSVAAILDGLENLFVRQDIHPIGLITEDPPSMIDAEL